MKNTAIKYVALTLMLSSFVFVGFHSGTAHAEGGGTIGTLQQWLVSGLNLVPRNTNYGLRVPSLGSTGNPCLNVGSTGIFATTTCGSGGTGTTLGLINIVHSDGTVTTYNATTSSDVGRGTALLTALSGTSVGDSVYLASSTFNIGNAYLDFASKNLSLYGAGMYSTVIKSTYDAVSDGSPIIIPGSNSTYSDFGYVSAAASGIYQYPIGNTGDLHDTLFRNIYIKNGSDGFYFAGSYTITSTTFDNVEVHSAWDAFIVHGGSQNTTGTLNVYNSRFYSIDDSTFGIPQIAEGFYCDTGGTPMTVNFWNTSFYATSTVSNAYPVNVTGCTVNLYSGQAFSSSKFAAQRKDIIQNGLGVVNVASAFIYDPTKTIGTISYLDNAPIRYSLGSNGASSTVLWNNNGVANWVATSSLGLSSGGSLSGGTADMLAAWTSSSALTATGTPTAAAYIATSTTATSTFPIVRRGEIVTVHPEGSMTSLIATTTTNVGRGTALLTAVSMATDGDVMYLGGGTYDLGTSCVDLSKAGTVSVSLMGQGVYQTTVTSAASIASGCGTIRPGSYSEVAYLTIQNTVTSTTGMPYGVNSATYSIASTTLHDFRILGTTDGVFLGTDSTHKFNANIYDGDIISNWDHIVTNALNSTDNTSTLNLYNIRIKGIASTTLTSTMTAVTPQKGGVINLYSVSIDMPTAATELDGVNASVFGAPPFPTVNFFSGSITSTGTTTVSELKQGGSAVVNVSGTVKYNTASTTGTITYLDSNPLIRSLRRATDFFGLGSTTPWRTLSVNGSSDLGNSALAGYFTATTSTASVFPYASTTALSATTLCLTGDACKTTWPISSPATSTNPLMYSYGIATSTTATSTFAKSVIVGTTTVTTVNNESLKVVGSGSTYTDSANCILHITADKNGNTGAVLGAKNGLCIGVDNQTTYYEGNPYFQAYIANGAGTVPISFNPQGGGIYLNTQLGDTGAATTIAGSSGKNAYIDLQNIVTDGSKPYTAYVFQPSATLATFEKGALVYDTSTDYWNCCYARALGGFGIALDYQTNNTNALDNLPNDLRFNIKPNSAFSDFGVGIGTTTPTAKLSVMGGCASCSGGSGGVLDLIQVATSTGSPVWGIDNDGHRYTSGPKPTISSCGTGTGTVNGDDSGGTITTATAATACTMTFAKAYQGTSLYCNVTDDSLVGFADVSATSTTAVTFGISSALTGGHLYYQCSYHK